MLSHIIEIKKIREEQEQLKKREKQLREPRLKDFSFIPQVYEWFCELSEKQNCPSLQSIIQRKKFLFIILILYSPASIMGGNMTRGLREELCTVFKLQSASGVSNYCSEAIFYYQQYKDFRADVDQLWYELLRRIEEYSVNTLAG